jgi:hypothetical protein
MSRGLPQITATYTTYFLKAKPYFAFGINPKARVFA